MKVLHIAIIMNDPSGERHLFFRGRLGLDSGERLVFGEISVFLESLDTDFVGTEDEY
jgi:hypothetical protein